MKPGLLGAILVGAWVPAAAQRVTYEGALVATSGKYIFTEATNTMALTTGLAVTAGPLTVRGSWPVWLQNNHLLTANGVGALPTGGTRGARPSATAARRAE